MTDLDRLTEALAWHADPLRQFGRTDIEEQVLDEIEAAACAYRDLLANGERVGWMQDDWGLPVVGYFKNRAWFDNDEQRFLVIPLVDRPTEEE